jgi:hypothetical protein
LPVAVATDPTVLATSLAAHGSDAAVADGELGAVIANTTTPPAADIANMAPRRRRARMAVVFMADSLWRANALVASHALAIGVNPIARPELTRRQ